MLQGGISQPCPILQDSGGFLQGGFLGFVVQKGHPKDSCLRTGTNGIPEPFVPPALSAVLVRESTATTKRGRGPLTFVPTLLATPPAAFYALLQQNISPWVIPVCSLCPPAGHLP